MTRPILNLVTPVKGFSFQLVRGKSAVLVDVCHSFDEAMRNATARSRRTGHRHMVLPSPHLRGRRLVWRLVDEKVEP